MSRIEASIEIAAPPTTVFRFSHDLDRRSEWDERVVGIALITSAPVRRGSLIRIDAGRGRQFQFTWEGEYTEYHMSSGSTLKVIDAAPASPFKSGLETWRLSQTEGGTRFTLTWEYQSRGMVSRVLDFLGRRGATRRTIRQSLKNLRTLIEAE
jgi:uncharacterized protein YndB with AHSA1/START domain